MLVLLALTLLLFVLPWCWPARKAAAPDKALLQQLDKQMGQLKQESEGPKAANPHAANPPPYSPASMGATAQRPGGRLFYFDPNSLPEAGWKALGLRDKTIQTIVHYLEKGGRFRQPEDLGKVYGLYPDEYARLFPFIRIEQPAPAAKKEYSGVATASYSNSKSYTPYLSKAATAHVIEINAADTLSFSTLPGIGNRLAARIVHFRDKLGGFYSVEQVGETFALPDSVFQQIKQWLRCDSSTIHRVNINTADAAILKQHPYIRWNIANAIVEYRRQHGIYKSVDELQRIDIIEPELFRKLKPYLDVQ